MAGTASRAIDLTVLIPVYNEAGNVLPLMREVAEALGPVCPFEVIFVDDGSDDAMAAELAALQRADARVRVIRHGRRAGKSTALVTGFRMSRAPWIQTLDGDGQNDPKDAAALWRQLHRPEPPRRLGLVAGVRRRRHDGALKWLSSRVANAIRRALLKDGTPDAGCGFKLIRRELAIELPLFDGLHRFLPAFARTAGYDVMQFPVNDRPRTRGRSKYGFFDRLGAGTVDLLGVLWLMRRGARVGGVEHLADQA